ncbi:MAG: ABC transporter ATP-binding protein, partial [Spirochaetes bacterium]|nr:ABC transporter ATP-binding protein [Spirochaetota bacterium]
FGGTLLLVSHDRAFLNNVVTSTLAFEGDAVVRECAGGYDDWLNRKTAAAPRAEKPAVERRERKPVEKTKLTFREKEELKGIPDDIELKERRMAEIYALMADPAFYQKSGQKVVELKAEIEALELRVEELYRRWDALSVFEGAE